MSTLAVDTKLQQEISEYKHKNFKKLIFTSKTISSLEIAKRMNPVLESIKKHPEALKLLNDVLATGPVQVDFCQHITMKSSASWNPSKRTIELSDKETNLPELIDCLVFELCNADNTLFIESRKKQLKLLKMDNYIDSKIKKEESDLKDSLDKRANEFALFNETAECQTANRAADIENSGITQYGWPYDGCFKKRVIRELKEYLEDVQKPALGYHGLSHFQAYIKQFYERILDGTTVEMEAVSKTIEQWKKTHEHLSSMAVQISNLLQNISSEKNTIDNYACVKQAADLIQENRIKLEQTTLLHNIAKQALEKLEEEAKQNREKLNLVVKSIKEKESLFLEKMKLVTTYSEGIVAAFTESARDPNDCAAILKIFGENKTNIDTLNNATTIRYDAALPLLETYLKKLESLKVDMDNKKEQFQLQQSKKSAWLGWIFSCCRKNAHSLPTQIQAASAQQQTIDSNPNKKQQ